MHSFSDAALVDSTSEQLHYSLELCVYIIAQDLFGQQQIAYKPVSFYDKVIFTARLWMRENKTITSNTCTV